MSDNGADPEQLALSEGAGVAHALWQYDATDKIVFVTHPTAVDLVTREEIAAYFEHGLSHLRTLCRGEKVYIIVDYQNLTSNIDLVDFYASQVKRLLDEGVKAIVRFNGNMLQRMTSRMTAIKLRTPSNTFASREEAIQAVREMQRADSGHSG